MADDLLNASIQTNSSIKLSLAGLDVDCTTNILFPNRLTPRLSSEQSHWVGLPARNQSYTTNMRYPSSVSFRIELLVQTSGSAKRTLSTVERNNREQTTGDFFDDDEMSSDVEEPGLFMTDDETSSDVDEEYDVFSDLITWKDQLNSACHWT